jgi:hypothetical protein
MIAMASLASQDGGRSNHAYVAPVSRSEASVFISGVEWMTINSFADLSLEMSLAHGIASTAAQAGAGLG